MSIWKRNSSNKTKEFFTEDIEDIEELSRLKLCSVFNKKIFSLLNFTKTKFDEATTTRIINLIKVAKRMDHEVIITTMGPYLLKYQNLIQQRAHSAFSPEHFKQELNKYSTTSENSKSKKMANDLFTTIYGSLDSLDASEFEKVYKCADDLIDIYLNFCLRCRTEEKR